MKKYIAALILFCAVGCKKDIQTVSIPDDDDTEIQDFDFFDDFDETSYQSEAAKMKVTAVTTPKVVPAGGCDKFQDWFILNSKEGNQGTDFAIKGYGFGATQGQSTVDFLFDKARTVKPTTIASWSDTLINLSVGKVPDETKSVPTYLRVNKKTVTPNLIASSKRLRCVGSIGYFHFGQAWWEVSLQRSIMGLPNAGARKDARYKYGPKKGDVLIRDTFSANIVGVIMTEPLPGPNSSFSVWERNLNCRGSIKKRPFKTRDSVIVARKGENSFVSYMR